MEQPADTLRADQVVLRRWRVTDLDALERAIGESVDHLLPWLPWAAGHSRRQTADFLARSHDQWETGRAFGYAITSGAALIGGCGLHRRIGAGGLDIGYWIHPHWTGRGLMTMAAVALVDQGFRLAGIDRVEIHHDVANPASGAVARRLGFTGIEPAPEPLSAPGESGTDVIWRLTVDRWRARRSEQARRAG